MLGLCIVTLLLAPMYAQKSTGTLRGVVTDPSGAVVSGVPVVIHNDATGLTRTVNTNAQGEYVAAEIPAGVYSITVKAPNFKEVVSNAVELHVASTETLNIQLQVGSASEQVTVNASEVQVQTDNAALGEVVNGEQVRELPLNGRSFVQLTQLQPGVSAANSFDSKNKGLLSGVDFSVNGNATTNNLFLVDGANNNDVGSNRTILIYPSIEAISEFKMLRNSYGPEYGQASGAVINIVTRSGSNQWHGSLLYFGRNDALNATEYFAHAAEVAAKANGGKGLPNNGKDTLRRNDYGFSVGGPIKKDKLFFFYSQEWNKEKRGETRNSCVPTVAEVSGDFSQDFHDNGKGQFVDQCNQPRPNIPTNLQAAGNPYKFANISPAGHDILLNFPAPNLGSLLANGANWSQSLPTPINWRQENARIDFNISHSQTLMFRYTQDNWENPFPNGTSALGLWGDDPWPTLESNWAQPSKQIVGRLTSTIGTSMVNDAEFAYSNNRINITPGGTNPGLLAQTTRDLPPGYPFSVKTSQLGIPTLWGGVGGYGSGNNLWLIAPWNNSLDIYTVRDDFSKVVSNHTFRFGGFLGWQGKNEDIGATSASEYPQFGASDWDTSIPTGNGAANLLAPGAKWGWVEQSKNVNAHIRWRDYETYAADNWKVRRNLTLDLGVRYSILAPPFQPDNQYTNFIPSLYNPALGSADACNGLWTVPGTNPCGAANQVYGTTFTSGTPGPNKSLKYTNYHLFAPRLGISWDPTGSGNSAIRAGFGQFYQRDRVSGPYYTLAGNAPFALSGNFTRTLDAQPATTFPKGSAAPTGTVDPGNTTSNSLQWNLAIEHGFTKNTTLEVGYVGNHAIHQLNNYAQNIIPPSQWLAGAFLSGSSQNALRTFPGWGNMVYWLNNGDATYHALQVLGKTQMRRLQLQAAYTWSHSIGDITQQNSDGGAGWQSYTLGSNPRLDRGNTSINRPQVFVANAVYFLPDLKGQNGLVQGVAGGWELGAITQYASGTSTTLYQGAVGEDTSQVVGSGGGALSSLYGSGFTNNVRPLVSGQGCTGNTHGPTVINPGAVTLIGYQIGTIPSNTEPRGYCHGPGLVNTDLSIDKNWRAWGERLRIQFRLDFFNLFNHANFRGDRIGSVDGGTAFNNVNCGAPNGAGLYAACSPTNNIITRQTENANVGVANLTRGGREIQYGLKIIF